MSFFLSGVKCLDPRRLRKDPHARKNSHLWAGKANSWRTTVGPAPARGFVLMALIDFARLDLSATHTLTLKDQARTINLPGVVVGDAYAVTAGYETDPNTCYLVELTDLRHLAQMTSLDQSFNVRAPARGGTGLYYDDTTNAGTAWTWVSMLTQIWAQVAAAVPEWGAFPGLPAAPTGTPENFRFHGVSAWAAFNDVLRHLAMVVGFNPYTGLPAIYRAGDADTTSLLVAAAERQYKPVRVDDYYPLTGSLHGAAATVRVFFPKAREHYGTGKDTGWAAGEQDAASPVHSVDVATGIAGARAGSKHVVYADLPALVNFAGTVTNAADLSARATEYAADYVRARTAGGVIWRQYGNFLKDARLVPCGRLSGIAWFDVGRGWVTELVNLRDAHERAGLLQGYAEGGHDGLKRARLGERLGAPERGRATYQGTYPQYSHNVECTSATSVDTDVYPGRIQRVNPSVTPVTESPGEDVYLYSMDGVALTSGAMFPGARLVGAFDKGGTITKRPLYAVRGGSGAGESDPSVRFMKCKELDGLPNGDNRYDFRIQEHNADGTLADTGASVWGRDANNLGFLFVDINYLGRKTGFADGRDVYTLQDANLTISNESFTQIQFGCLLVRYKPDGRWNLTNPGPRQLDIEQRDLDVVDLRTGTTYTDVYKIEFDSTPTAYNPALGDYAFTWNPTTHVLKIRLNGRTASDDWVYTCANGILRKWTQQVVNGLVKNKVNEGPA